MTGNPFDGTWAYRSLYNDPDLQRSAAWIGSVTRTIPHPSSNGGISPAGVVGSFYAVKVDL